MSLYSSLLKYKSIFQEENEYRERMLKFLDSHKHPYNRETADGHITGSALLLNSDRSKFLLMHHRKLNKWLQPGGHCDGDEDVLAVALKEAKEESGIEDIEPVSTQIYDIDIHCIPANSKEEEHFHYDVRFLLKTVNNDLYVINNEANELKWIEFESYDPTLINLDYSVERMIKKFKLNSY